MVRFRKRITKEKLTDGSANPLRFEVSLKNVPRPPELLDKYDYLVLDKMKS